MWLMMSAGINERFSVSLMVLHNMNIMMNVLNIVYRRGWMDRENVYWGLELWLFLVRELFQRYDWGIDNWNKNANILSKF